MPATNSCARKTAKKNSFSFSVLGDSSSPQAACSGGTAHLDDDEQTDPCPHLRRVPVHAGHHVDDGLADGDDHPKH